MSAPFTLEIISQEKKVLENPAVESVTMRTLAGEITVLAHHIPYVSVLKAGEIIVRGEGKEEIFALTGGVIEVDPDGVTILTDSAIRSDEIDELAAEEARERAEKLMAEELSDRESAEVEAALQKALLHIQVAKRRRHHP